MMGMSGAAAKVEMKAVKKENQERWKALMCGRLKDHILMAHALCSVSTGRSKALPFRSVACVFSSMVQRSWSRSDACVACVSTWLPRVLCLFVSPFLVPFYVWMRMVSSFRRFMGWCAPRLHLRGEIERVDGPMDPSKRHPCLSPLGSSRCSTTSLLHPRETPWGIPWMEETKRKTIPSKERKKDTRLGTGAMALVSQEPNHTPSIRRFRSNGCRMDRVLATDRRRNETEPADPTSIDRDG